MNRISCFCFLLLFALTTINTVAQPPIHFEKDNFAEAAQKAEAANKPLLLMCYASWCPHCNKMKQEVFTDPSVAAFYNEHFVCEMIDMEKGEGIKLHSDLGIRSYPTFIFFDTAGNVVYRTTGEFKAPAFLTEGINAMNPEKQLPILKQRFESNLNDAEGCYDYIRVLKKAELDCSDALAKYFSAQKKDHWISEVNWRIIANGVTKIDDPLFQFVSAHQQAFSAVASPERVERKIFVLVRDLLIPAVVEKDSVGYFKYRGKSGCNS